MGHGMMPPVNRGQIGMKLNICAGKHLRRNSKNSIRVLDQLQTVPCQEKLSIRRFPIASIPAGTDVNMRCGQTTNSEPLLIGKETFPMPEVANTGHTGKSASGVATGSTSLHRGVHRGHLLHAPCPELLLAKS